MLDEISDIVVACGVEPDRAPDAHLSLELAALLGPPIHADEWRAACDLCGVEASEELVGELVHNGVATRSEDGWVFKDDSLVDDLIGYIKQARAWKSHHFACANALFIVAPTQRPGVARRRVAHLIEAGNLEEALEPLLAAEREAYDNGAYDDSHAYLDTRESLLDELGAEAEDPRRAQNDWRRAQLLQVHGERSQALALVDKSRRMLQCTDWASERGHAALLHGQMLRDEGRFEEARQCFDRASRHYGDGGDDSGLAASRANLGFLELEHARPARAREYFQGALRVFEQIEDSFMISSMWSQMGYAWLMDGEREEATRCAQHARHIARDAGHKPIEGSAWTTLGEIARDVGDWDEARTCCEKAIELRTASNDRNLHVVRYNLALVEVGAGRYDVARELFEEVKERFSELGFGPRAPLVNAGLMVCCAAEASWEGFAHHHQLACQSVGEVGLGDTDLVWLAQKAAALAEAQGHTEAKRMADALARVCV